ncbi:unnamed protein product [Penicillium crustosum]
MKFTGLTVSLALAGLGYSAALPVPNNAEGTVPGIESAVGGLTGAAAGFVAPITSTAGGLAGAIKRDGTAPLGETVKSVPSLANGAVAIAGGAVGTGESLVSGVAGTAENAVPGASPAAKPIIKETKAGGLTGAVKRDETVPSLANSAVGIAGSAVGTAENAVSGAAAKRQLNNDLIGSTLGSAIPAIIKETKAGGLTGAVKRDETVPGLANSAVGIAGSAVGTGESLASGVAGTAENAVSDAAAKRQLNNDVIGSTLGSAIPAIIQETKAGGLAGAVKRDGTAGLGDTIDTIPSLANSAAGIAGNAVGTAGNAVGHA